MERASATRSLSTLKTDDHKLLTWREPPLDVDVDLVAARLLMTEIFESAIFFRC